MELRSKALEVLCDANPQTQVQAVQALWAQRAQLRVDTQAVLQAPSVPLPGRPDKPVLMPPQQVPSRSVHTPQGLAALRHLPSGPCPPALPVARRAAAANACLLSTAVRSGASIRQT